MKAILVLLIITFAIVSCGEKIVRDNPREQYRQCLRENEDNPSKCDHLKESYQQRFKEHRDVYYEGSGSEEGYYWE